jgi:hypothetical protein
VDPAVQEALKMLTNTKRELKEDLTVKAVSLVIDRQKCMAMRLSFPYHTRHLEILEILKSRNPGNPGNPEILTSDP